MLSILKRCATDDYSSYWTSVSPRNQKKFVFTYKGWDLQFQFFAQTPDGSEDKAPPLLHDVEIHVIQGDSTNDEPNFVEPIPEIARRKIFVTFPRGPKIILETWKNKFEIKKDDPKALLQALVTRACDFPSNLPLDTLCDEDHKTGLGTFFQIVAKLYHEPKAPSQGSNCRLLARATTFNSEYPIYRSGQRLVHYSRKTYLAFLHHFQVPLPCDIDSLTKLAIFSYQAPKYSDEIKFFELCIEKDPQIGLSLLPIAIERRDIKYLTKMYVITPNYPWFSSIFLL